MVKIVTLFLIALVVLAILGRLRIPGLGDWRKRGHRITAIRCDRCGAFLLGGERCSCPKKRP